MLCRPPIARPSVKLAEAEATVSEERAHAELQGQSLVTSFSALTGERHGTGAKVPCFLHATREEVRFAELHHAHRVQISNFGGRIAGQGLLQPGNAFLDAS